MIVKSDRAPAPPSTRWDDLDLTQGELKQTLKLMTRPPDTKLTPDVARELCQRAGSKVYIDGAIGSLGSKYVLALKAVNCQSAGTLASVQHTSKCCIKPFRTHRKTS